MYILLLIVGSVLFFCGFLLSVFVGIPNREFSYGETAITTGAIAVVGGLVVIGFGLVLRELRNIAANLKPNVGAAPRPAKAPAPVPAPAPVQKQQPRERPARSPEPPVPHQQAEGQPEAPPSPVEPPQQPAERPRPNIFAVARGAQAPLLPTEVPARARVEPPVRAPSPPEAEPLPMQRADVPHPAPSAEGAAERPRPNLFDSVWPNRSPEMEPASPPRERVEPALQAQPPRPPLQPSPITPSRRVEEPKAAILKSGVIDGMAYTLYTDGSIEAQLPQGVVRFASIDELRAHLERGG